VDELFCYDFCLVLEFRETPAERIHKKREKVTKSSQVKVILCTSGWLGLLLKPYL